jgi:hypothetical protein
MSRQLTLWQLNIDWTIFVYSYTKNYFANKGEAMFKCMLQVPRSHSET